MGLRDLYNQVERAATPILTDLTRTPEFARVASTVAGLNKALKSRADEAAARWWHLMNLPAGTDVQRLKLQLGELDREVRLLTLELERARKEAKRRGTSRPEHD